MCTYMYILVAQVLHKIDNYKNDVWNCLVIDNKYKTVTCPLAWSYFGQKDIFSASYNTLSISGDILAPTKR